MSYKQKTPMLHCAATVMHSKPWDKMRNRTAAVAGRGDGNKVGLAHAEKIRKTPLAKKETLKDVAGQLRKASKMHLGQAKVVEKHIEEMKNTPLKKQKGGGTTKTCLPAAKLRNMSKKEREKLVNAKRSAGAKGKYKRSSSTNVKGARKKGATLRDWFEKEDWRRVDDPSKKCGE
jgi:hypothetical protein|tara:strand:+ start:253 stop:777 length:525 start_codon:yes stop_codon:yes gene_type:complete